MKQIKQIDAACTNFKFVSTTINKSCWKGVVLDRIKRGRHSGDLLLILGVCTRYGAKFRKRKMILLDERWTKPILPFHICINADWFRTDNIPEQPYYIHKYFPAIDYINSKQNNGNNNSN